MRIARANPPVILDAETRKRCLELVDYLIDVPAYRKALCFRRALDIDPVLISAGEKEGVDASLPRELLERIGKQRGVGMAEVRLRVDVVDRGCYVEGVFFHVRASHSSSRSENRKSGMFRFLFSIFYFLFVIFYFGSRESSFVAQNERHRLRPCPLIFEEPSSQSARYRLRTGLFDSAHLYAHMLGFDDHHYSRRVQHLVE